MNNKNLLNPMRIILILVCIELKIEKKVFMRVELH
jgi:hypothetical protein